MRDQVDQARWIAVLAVTAIWLYLCWLMLRPFVGGRPRHRFLSRSQKHREQDRAAEFERAPVLFVSRAGGGFTTHTGHRGGDS